VVEHHLDTVGVTGSKPVSRTIFASGLFPNFCLADLGSVSVSSAKLAFWCRQVSVTRSVIDRSTPFLANILILLNFPSAANERHDEEHQKYDEQHFGDGGRETRDTKESKRPSQQCDQ